MNELAVKELANLPAKIEDLAKFVLFGREKLKSVRAEIRAIDQLTLATDVREQKLAEAQMLSGALLDAERKIGEFTLKMPTAADFLRTRERRRPLRQHRLNGEQARFADSERAIDRATRFSRPVNRESKGTAERSRTEKT